MPSLSGAARQAIRHLPAGNSACRPVILPAPGDQPDGRWGIAGPAGRYGHWRYSVLDETELRRMSPDERARVARAITAIDSPVSPGRPMDQRHRTLVLAGIIACCVVLAIWTGVLAVTLPRYYRAGGWRGAWVGFDLGLLITFAITAWAGWRHRQLVIVC